jgi:hypothetical protein
LEASTSWSGKVAYEEVENMKKGEASWNALAMPRLRASAHILEGRILVVKSVEYGLQLKLGGTS